jgi:hypothetical protein
MIGKCHVSGSFWVVSQSDATKADTMDPSDPSKGTTFRSVKGTKDPQKTHKKQTQAQGQGGVFPRVFLASDSFR